MLDWRAVEPGETGGRWPGGGEGTRMRNANHMGATVGLELGLALEPGLVPKPMPSGTVPDSLRCLR